MRIILSGLQRGQKEYLLLQQQPLQHQRSGQCEVQLWDGSGDSSQRALALPEQQTVRSKEDFHDHRKSWNTPLMTGIETGSKMVSWAHSILGADGRSLPYDSFFFTAIVLL